MCCPTIPHFIHLHTRNLRFLLLYSTPNSIRLLRHTRTRSIERDRYGTISNPQVGDDNIFPCSNPTQYTAMRKKWNKRHHLELAAHPMNTHLSLGNVRISKPYLPEQSSKPTGAIHEMKRLHEHELPMVSGNNPSTSSTRANRFCPNCSLNTVPGR